MFRRNVWYKLRWESVSLLYTHTEKKDIFNSLWTLEAPANKLVKKVSEMMVYPRNIVVLTNLFDASVHRNVLDMLHYFSIYPYVVSVFKYV